MRKFGKELTNIDTPHRQEGYSGIVSSLGEDGKTANIGNMNGSQIRGTKILLPYGIACVGMSGMNTHVMLDGNNSYINGRVNIVEIMGRNAGWLTASSSLATLNGAIVDLIYVPETPFNIEEFLKKVEKISNEML